MKKRIISCLLASVLVLSMLGCGESKATSGNTDTKAPEASVNEAQGEEKQEAADNGEKLSFAIPDGADRRRKRQRRML